MKKFACVALMVCVGLVAGCDKGGDKGKGSGSGAAPAASAPAAPATGTAK